VTDAGECLSDAELLALIQQRMTQAARQLAFGHLDACKACLELVAAVLRSLDENSLRQRARLR
jgi:hypothetical protein